MAWRVLIKEDKGIIIRVQDISNRISIQIKARDLALVEDTTEAKAYRTIKIVSPTKTTAMQVVVNSTITVDTIVAVVIIVVVFMETHLSDRQEVVLNSGLPNRRIKIKILLQVLVQFNQ